MSADTINAVSTEREQASLYFPKVSVIVPIYNGEQDLPGLLQCLMGQTYPKERVEFLLVDNGSRDRTPDILAAANEEFARCGLTLRILNERDIQSAYAARNTAVRAATGEFLAFTDADCYPQPGWLTGLMQPFKDKTLGLVAGKIIALPGTTLLESYAESKDIMSQEATLAHEFCPYGQTANLGVRLQALEHVGLFRPYLTTGGDADICWRVQKESDWTIQYAEDAVIQHRHRQTLKELYSQWHRYGTSNRYLHELHGVKLAWPMNPKDRARTIRRWALKELPLAAVKFVFAKGAAVDMVSAPLDLYCARARAKGQAEAKLPENARDKAQLSALDTPPLETSTTNA